MDARHAYAAYVQSIEWYERRQRYWAGHPRRCAICRTGLDVQLHHCRYRDLGREPDGDLLPLCAQHHRMVHAYAEGHPDLPLAEATIHCVTEVGGDASSVTPTFKAVLPEDVETCTSVRCQRCNAEVGERCIKYLGGGATREMVGFHNARRRAARDAARLGP
jgi:hypothetical protein